MKSYLSQSSRSSFKKIALGVTLGLCMVMGGLSSAQADDHRRDRDWDHHAAYAHHWRGRGYYAPGVVYAPPVVYSPPVYQSPGINLVLPLNFR